MRVATGDKQDGAPSKNLREESERARAGADEPLNAVDRLLKPETPPEVQKRYGQLSLVAVQQTFSFVDPFPRSSEVARYDEVMSGAADRT